MKKISTIFSFFTVFCLLLTVSAGVRAEDEAVFYVGNTNVTAVEEGTTYWQKDEGDGPATEFTQTGAAAGNCLFSVTYDAAEGYTLSVDGLDVTTYGVHSAGGSTHQGGILCLSDLDILVNDGGLSVTETAAAVSGIYVNGALDIAGTGDLTVSSAYIAVNTALTGDVGGEVALSCTGAIPTVVGNLSLTAGGDIRLTSANFFAVSGNTELTSENGGVTVSASSSNPAMIGNLTVEAYDDVTLENKGTGSIVQGTAEITSQNGGITGHSQGASSPAFIGATEMTAKGAINLINEEHMVFTSSADLTSENDRIMVSGDSANPVIAATATISAYGDVTVLNTDSGMVMGSAANLTSTMGSVTVTSASNAPTIVGTAAITAKADIIVHNDVGAAVGSNATLNSSAGKVSVIGNTVNSPVIVGSATVQAQGDIGITCAAAGGFAVGNSANLTSDNGKVTLSCDANAPLVAGDAKITAKGNVSLTNQGNNGMAISNDTDITSTAGTVTLSSAIIAPETESTAEITAYGDIILTATAEGGNGFCIGGAADFTSQHGSIDLSGNSTNPLFIGAATLCAATDLSAVNGGSGAVFAGSASLAAKNGDINVTSAGNVAANGIVTVNLGALAKAATFTAATCADPAGFACDMLAYRVFGGADKEHLAAVSLTDAKNYACVQFQLALGVTAGSTNLGDFTDHGSGHYTVTAADALTYEQGGTLAKGVYLGVYFNGLSGVNGTDYYLSYGDSAGVTWDEHKKITANGSEADPSLYMNLIDGEKTVYVYFDADGAAVHCPGIVLSLQYQIPDGAAYHDGAKDFTWNGDSWVQQVNNPFRDVLEGRWYVDDVLYVYEKGLMIGTGEDTFSPGDYITRGAIVTILWRLEGKPVAASAVSFADVADGAYYAPAVVWAAEHNLVKGYGQDKFGPKDVITREQFATILYRYAVYKGYDVSGSADLSGFTDAGHISAYALPAVKWANANGLMNGTSAAHLSPQNGATRAQAAALIHRFMVCFTESE
ncbi:MAG TPA: S-layer homology domain-containing protein [Clostridiales bacterium]|nr:S-layer homology domain-containing protein [Clostridiales bacterium]